MFGRKGNPSKDDSGGGEDLEKMESGSILCDELEVPEMVAKKKKASIVDLIERSPAQAVSVLRKWMLSDEEK